MISRTVIYSVSNKHASAPVASRVVIAMFFLGLLTACYADAQDSVRNQSFRLAGYLPDYRIGNFDLEAAKELTDLIVFSAEPAVDATLDLRRLKNAPWAKLKKLSTENRIRLILSVGGWDRSSQFAVVASSKANRERFAKSAVDFCLEQRFSGIDLDWEHPKDANEQLAYAELLKTVHTTFANHGLTLSITMAAWQELPAEAFQHVDWIQIMAYDHDGKHSTFDNAIADVAKVIKAGAPINKIVLGLPFYGRSLTHHDQAKSFAEIVAKQLVQPDVDEVDGFYFNGPSTIRRKAEYAITNGMAGVMVWEIGQDATGPKSLLRELRRSIDAIQAKGK